MKRLLFALVSFCCISAAAQESLPKDCFGKYSGEMPAYTVTKNDVEMNIDKHDVHLTITSSLVIYSSGNIELKGGYTFLKQGGGQYLIKAKLSNGKNLDYEIDLLWNKKTQTILFSGKNGEPDVVLEKLQNR